MKISLFCFSEAGAKLALKLTELLELSRTDVHSIARIASLYGFTPHQKISNDVGGLFAESDALLFIGACGIAVREIAPHVRTKTEDPAVVVIDDQGRFVIPILYGHIGGANDLARGIASLIGAAPVVTTSTDGAGRFSADAWASRNGYRIDSMEEAKKISAAILTRDVPVSSDYVLPETLPDGLVRGEEGESGVYIGVRGRTPFRTTLRLIPRTLTLGIGCRRGTEKKTLREAVEKVMKDNGLDMRAVGRIASIDVKKDEEGLRSLAAEMGAELLFFTADELNAVEGEFEESEFVKKTVGTGNVCERAAVLAGGKAIVRKTALTGVTVAVTEEERKIEF